jgi:hypothetical protein
MKYRVQQAGAVWHIIDAQRGVLLATCSSETTARWICELMNAAVA